jgi:hypothetical protein
VRSGVALLFYVIFFGIRSPRNTEFLQVKRNS